MKKSFGQKLFESWKSPVVARKELSRATGGLLNAKTMAVYDSMGHGIPGKFSLGYKTVGYPVKDVIEYIDKLYDLGRVSENTPIYKDRVSGGKSPICCDSLSCKEI
jgi:hypothetical protein